MKFIKQSLMVVISAMAITSCIKVDVGDQTARERFPGF